MNPVGGEPRRGERPVVAAEHGDVPDDVMALIPREPGALERPGHAAEEGGLVAGVPERDGVAPAAELEAQHARDAVERHRPPRTPARRDSRSPPAR